MPLAAGAWPVYRGVRVTVREAIASAGISDNFGRSRFDRLLQRIKGPSRPTLLSIRNTFRRKSRLVLTLLALTLGGAVFMSVFTLRASLGGTVDETLAYFNYDAQVQLTQPTRTNVLVRTAEQVPGVVAAEPWTFASAQRVRPDDTTSGNQVVFGLPDGATTVRPVVEEGRFLVPGDGNALVVTRNFLDDETDVKIGDRITLRTKGRDAEFTLVGIVQSPTQRPFLYAPSAALDTLTRDAGKAGLLMLVTERQDATGQRETGAAVRDTLDRAGMEVAQVQTRSEIRASIDTLFTTMLLFVSVMALLLGVVGGLGLAGTMTMNVVERSREIGVMRAIGARDSRGPRRVHGRGPAHRVPRLADRRDRVAAHLQDPVRRAGRVVRAAATRLHAGDRRDPGLARRRRRARPGGVVPARLAGDPARRPRGPGVRMSAPAPRQPSIPRRPSPIHRIMAPYRHEAPSMTANPPSTRRPRWPIALVVVIVIAIAVAVGVGSGWFGGPGAGASAQPSASLEGVVPADAGVVAEGRAVPVRWAELVPGAAGRVAAIPVAVGDTVAEGDVVLQLDDEAASARGPVGDRGLHGGAGGDGAGGGLGRPGARRT